MNYHCSGDFRYVLGWDRSREMASIFSNQTNMLYSKAVTKKLKNTKKMRFLFSYEDHRVWGWVKNRGKSEGGGACAGGGVLGGGGLGPDGDG